MTTHASVSTSKIEVYNIKVNDDKLEQKILEITYNNDLNACNFFITCKNATKLKNILEKYISEPAKQDKKQYDIATNIDDQINQYIYKLNKLKSTTNIYQSLKSRLGLQLKVKEKFLQTREYLLKKNKEAYKINYLKFIKLKLEIRLTKLKISDLEKKVKQEEKQEEKQEDKYKIEVLYKQINKQKKNTQKSGTPQISAEQQPDTFVIKTGIIKEINVNAKTFKLKETPENKKWTDKFAKYKQGKFIELCVINNNTPINITNIDNNCKLTQKEQSPDTIHSQGHRSRNTI